MPLTAALSSANWPSAVVGPQHAAGGHRQRARQIARRIEPAAAALLLADDVEIDDGASAETARRSRSRSTVRSTPTGSGRRPCSAGTIDLVLRDRCLARALALLPFGGSAGARPDRDAGQLRLEAPRLFARDVQRGRAAAAAQPASRAMLHGSYCRTRGAAVTTIPAGELRQRAVTGWSSAILAILAGAADQLELAPLDLLLEDPEPRLLMDVEHLVDRRCRPCRISAAVTRFELLQRGEPLLDHSPRRRWAAGCADWSAAAAP